MHLYTWRILFAGPVLKLKAIGKSGIISISNVYFKSYRAIHSKDKTANIWHSIVIPTPVSIGLMEEQGYCSPSILKLEIKKLKIKGAAGLKFLEVWGVQWVKRIFTTDCEFSCPTQLWGEGKHQLPRAWKPLEAMPCRQHYMTAHWRGSTCVLIPWEFTRLSNRELSVSHDLIYNQRLLSTFFSLLWQFILALTSKKQVYGTIVYSKISNLKQLFKVN